MAEFHKNPDRALLASSLWLYAELIGAARKWEKNYAQSD